jgi:hypothetical protein
METTPAFSYDELSFLIPATPLEQLRIISKVVKAEKCLYEHREFGKILLMISNSLIDLSFITRDAAG